MIQSIEDISMVLSFDDLDLFSYSYEYIEANMYNMSHAATSNNLNSRSIKILYCFGKKQKAKSDLKVLSRHCPYRLEYVSKPDDINIY